MLKSVDRWYGVTYKEDKKMVTDAIQGMKDGGLYPKKTLGKSKNEEIGIRKEKWGMSKLMKSLPFRLVLGVAIGIIAGLIANESFMNLVVTLNYIFGQIDFCCVTADRHRLLLPRRSRSLERMPPDCLSSADSGVYIVSWRGAVFDGSRIYADSAYVDSVGSRWTAQSAGGCL